MLSFYVICKHFRSPRSTALQQIGGSEADHVGTLRWLRVRDDLTLRAHRIDAAAVLNASGNQRCYAVLACSVKTDEQCSVLSFSDAS